jgi:hypothetical protein
MRNSSHPKIYGKAGIRQTIVQKQISFLWTSRVIPFAMKILAVDDSIPVRRIVATAASVIGADCEGAPEGLDRARSA